jgi:reverse transcriptase-like protein
MIAMANKWEILQYDIKNAFIHAKIDKEIYVIQPTGFAQNNSYKVCKLLKALYGLKQSPRLWYKHLKEELLAVGFIVYPYDEGIFIHKEYNIIVVCHVDDFYITGPDKGKIHQICEKLSKRLKLKFLGVISSFLGNEITLDYKNQQIFISQCKYTAKILEKYNKSIKTLFGNNTKKQYGVNTPFEAGVRLRKST